MFFEANVFAAESEWVKRGPDGKLEYRATERGDKIIDFSYCGYMGGGVAIPDVPVKMRVAHTADGATTAIQQAIDAVAAMPEENGIRGAVLVAPGVYELSAPLRIGASGVVLRGSGSGEDGTVLQLGRANSAFSIGGGRGGRGQRVQQQNGDGPAAEAQTVATSVSDEYVASGAMSFSVADASGLKIGDTIRLIKPVTPAWVEFMGMDKMVRGGKKQTWLSGELETERRVAAIEGNRITVDVPLTDSYDAKYLNPPGTRVEKAPAPTQLSQCGVENLRITAPPQNVSMGQARVRAFSVSGAIDSWVRDVAAIDTVNSVSVGGGSRRITLQKVSIDHTVPTLGAAKPADFTLSGPQVLLDQCSGTGDNLFFIVTGARVSGPWAVLNCTFKGNGWIQPHARWATGLLIDNCSVPNGGIDFMNRGSMGSGHGWSVGWAVAWNSAAKSFLNQLPPGCANWVIGGKGERAKRAIPFLQEPLLPEGIYDSHGENVDPKSLYLAQLEERLGPEAVKNIGY